MDYQHHEPPTEDYIRWDYYEAVLQAFDIDDRSVAVDTLRKHLARKYDDIRRIHPARFEMLCADVFRDFFECEVIHTGASHDGGIDLYGVLTDKEPFAVQCKRRAGPATESVDTVRAFLGALVANGVFRGLFVSTADHFSREAEELTRAQPLKSLGLQVQLLDYKSFGEIFALTNPPIPNPWEALLPK